MFAVSRVIPPGRPLVLLVIVAGVMVPVYWCSPRVAGVLVRAPMAHLHPPVSGTVSLMPPGVLVVVTSGACSIVTAVLLLQWGAGCSVSSVVLTTPGTPGEAGIC